MKKKVLTAIGLMSGTSMDGVDLSLIKSDGNNEFLSILDDYCEFDDELKEKLIKLKKKIFSAEDLNRFSEELDDLEREITLFHSKLIIKVSQNIDEKIDLIGFHGQTIFHNSDEKISRQLGDGNLLSQITKTIVVNNFRKKDLANEGQGAPLTPIFHKLVAKLISEKSQINYPINIVNIGGITNITNVLNENKNLFASDIGPGNCLIDEWIRKNSKKNFDDNGKIAKSGTVNELILNQAKENFTIKSFEKSLDINDFDLSFIKGLNFEDGCATLTNFTAFLISQGIKYTIKLPNNLNGTHLVCGGGRKNDYLIELINNYLIDKNIKLKNIDEYGFNGDFIESQTFGYLAIRSYLNLPISFPETTGCKKAVTGGEIIIFD